MGKKILPDLLGRCKPGHAKAKMLAHTRVWCSRRVCLVVLDSCCHGVRCSHCCFCCVEVGFFLKFPYVLLVPDSLVAKPVRYLSEKRKYKIKRGEPKICCHAQGRLMYKSQEVHCSPISAGHLKP